VTANNAAPSLSPPHGGEDGHPAHPSDMVVDPPQQAPHAPAPSGSPSPAPAPKKILDIPRFWFPPSTSTAASREQASAEQVELSSINGRHPGGIPSSEFKVVATKVCGYASFFGPMLFERMVGEGNAAAPTCSLGQATAWWEANCRGKCPATRVFNLLRSPGKEFVTRDNWKAALACLLDTHPGLEFLKSTPEFQDRYLECVVERMFYTNSPGESDGMTLREMRKSNIPDVLLAVDEEPDINVINDYFSYEHFYVLYCKFWELDLDHDFLLDREDLIKLGNYSLTYRIVDRIFEGACRRITSGVPEKLGYLDFIWLLLSEEDKTSDTALRYWFNGVDLDGDGYIRPHEMEYFYKEQIHRMDCLAQEVIQFSDVLCQMSDMVKPKEEGKVSLLDLRNCGQAGIFLNVLFNLTKFIQSEQRDPNQIFHERATPELTDWDRYAKVEYARLSMEEEDGDVDGEWDADGGAGGLVAMAVDSST